MHILYGCGFAVLTIVILMLEKVIIVKCFRVKTNQGIVKQASSTTFLRLLTVAILMFCLRRQMYGFIGVALGALAFIKIEFFYLLNKFKKAQKKTH